MEEGEDEAILPDGSQAGDDDVPPLESLNVGSDDDDEADVVYEEEL